MTVLYTEWKTLQSRGAVDPGPDYEVDGSLLVGTKEVIHFYDNHSAYGEDSVSIFPAFHDGKRCWVRRERWEAAEHYSASGTQEYIINFEVGVKELINRGMFNFPRPESSETK